MKTAVVTGATSGIGYAVAKELLQAGWRVIGIGRSKENSQKAKTSLQAAFPKGNIAYFTADLMQQREVIQVAREVKAYLSETNEGALELLVNNAGAVRTWYTTTEEGYEQQFALNHLAGFLLTHCLFTCLRKAKGMMILTGSGSHKHYSIRWEDMMYQKRRYSCLGAYQQSKLCNLLFAKEFNRRFENEGVRAYVVDPGLVNTDIGQKQTGFVVGAFWSIRKKKGVLPEEAAKTYAYLFGAEEAPKGIYFYQSKAAAYDRQVDRPGHGERLFELSRKLCGMQAYGGDTV